MFVRVFLVHLTPQYEQVLFLLTQALDSSDLTSLFVHSFPFFISRLLIIVYLLCL